MSAAQGIDLFAPGAASTLVLTASRAGGLVLAAPVFSARVVPAQVRTALVVLLAIMLLPAARAFAPGDVALTPVTIVGETLVGLTIGLGAALLIGAAESAGDLIAIQIGLSGAALVDPLSHQQSTAVGQFMQLFAIALLLAVNGHLTMIDAFAASVRSVPVGGAHQLVDGTREMLAAAASLFALGLRFAAPVVAVVLVANVALAVLSRAAPQLNILQLAFPVQILVGLAALIAAIPFFASWFSGWDAAYDALLTRVMDAFAGRTR